VSKRLSQKSLGSRIAADDTIERHDRSRWDLGRRAEKISGNEMNRIRTTASFGFAGSGGNVGRRSVDGNRFGGARVQQLERQCPNPRANVENDATRQTGFCEAVSQETRSQARPLHPVAVEIARGDPFGELPIRGGTVITAR